MWWGCHSSDKNPSQTRESITVFIEEQWAGRGDFPMTGTASGMPTEPAKARLEHRIHYG